MGLLKKNPRNWRVKSGQPLTEMDKKILAFQNRGCLVPTRDLIKTPEQIEGIRKAGQLNTAVLDYVAERIREGMSTLEIDQLVYDFTTKHGGIPAPLNYEGFPKSCCTSLNEVVCHGIPSDEEVLEEGDIINVRFYCDANKQGSISVMAAVLDPELFWQAYDKLSASTQELTPFENTFVEGTINCNRNGLVYCVRIEKRRLRLCDYIKKFTVKCKGNYTVSVGITYVDLAFLVLKRLICGDINALSTVKVVNDSLLVCELRNNKLYIVVTVKHDNSAVTRVCNINVALRIGFNIRSLVEL